MTDRPILFSGPMVRALLDGRKTQTRRVLHVQPPEWVNYCEQPQMLNVLHQWVPSGLWRWAELDESGHLALRQWPLDEDGLHYWIRPRFSVRDRLWVRETWAPLDALTHNDPGPRALADRGFYRADEGTVQGEISRWRPAIHMPRSASRLTLAVSDVRVERLQDISEEDAIEEGITRHGRFFGVADADWDHASTESARMAYANLWDSLNASRGYGWDANPWVCAITFSVHHQNIDALGAREAA